MSPSAAGICKDFWTIQEAMQKRQFVTNLIQEVPTTKVNGTYKLVKSLTRMYTFYVGIVSHRVCKPFFLNTLGVSDKYARNCLKKTGVSGVDEKLINAPNYAMHMKRKKVARDYQKVMKEAAVKYEII